MSSYENFFKSSKSMNKWITSTKKKINELNKVYGPVNRKGFPGRAAISNQTFKSLTQIT